PAEHSHRERGRGRPLSVRLADVEREPRVARKLKAAVAQAHKISIRDILKRARATAKRRLQAPASFSAWLMTPRPGRGFISTRTGFVYARRLRGTRTLFTTCSRTPTSCMAWAKSPSQRPRKHEPSSKNGSALGERTGSVLSL